MTPEQLKASILQYAIQGKLVEQRAEEGDAEELYQQIQAEKQKLIKEGKIKKEKPLPDIVESEVPFDIPESWKWVRLNNVVYNHGQKTPNTIFSYIDIGSIDNIHQKLNAEETLIESAKAPSRARKIVKAGDIIYSTVRPYLHNTCIIDKNFKAEPIASTGFAVLACHRGLYNKYLFYYLLAPAFDNYANATDNAKGVAYPAINDDKLYRAPIALPPLAEQHRIVAKIEELLPYVDRYAKSWNELEQLNAKFPEDMKKSILQYAIQGKLVEQRPEEGDAEEMYQQIQAEKQKLIKEGKIKKEKTLPEITESEIPFDIPESWKWVRLGEVINFQGGYAFKSDTYVPSSNNQVIRLGNVKDNNLLTHSKEVFISDELAKIAEDYQIKVDDILVTMTGTRRKKDYFFTLVVKSNDLMERKLYLNQRVGCFRAMSGIDVKYLLVVLQTSSIKDIIFLHETGTANQGNLGSEDMKKFVYIPLPPLAEQHRIVAKIEELLPYCDRLAKN
jgi:type I restriction enzyme S subunit